MVTCDELRKLGDVNGDGVINDLDEAALQAAFGARPGDPRWNAWADLNDDGIVDGKDMFIIVTNKGMSCRRDVWFPGLTFPGFKIPRGLFIDITIWGQGLCIPWTDVTLPAVPIIKPFKLFGWGPLIDMLLGPIGAVASKVLGALQDPRGTFKTWLDQGFAGFSPLLDALGSRIQTWLDNLGLVYKAVGAETTAGVIGALQTIPDMVWNLAKKTLDDMAADFYERHPEFHRPPEKEE